MINRLSIMVILGVLLVNLFSPKVISETLSLDNQPQSLPITAQVLIADQMIKLEEAKTPQQQALGLMYRQSLPGDRGMLFSFSPPRIVRFWMKNVKIPLDMIFVRDGEVKEIASNVPPCNIEACPIYGPENTLIDQVIELRGGRATELALEVGDRLIIEFLDNP